MFYLSALFPGILWSSPPPHTKFSATMYSTVPCFYLRRHIWHSEKELIQLLVASGDRGAWEIRSAAFPVGILSNFFPNFFLPQVGNTGVPFPCILSSTPYLFPAGFSSPILWLILPIISTASNLWDSSHLELVLLEWWMGSRELRSSVQQI